MKMNYGNFRVTRKETNDFPIHPLCSHIAPHIELDTVFVKGSGAETVFWEAQYKIGRGKLFPENRDIYKNLEVESTLTRQCFW